MRCLASLWPATPATASASSGSRPAGWMLNALSARCAERAAGIGSAYGVRVEWSLTPEIAQHARVLAPLLRCHKQLWHIARWWKGGTTQHISSSSGYRHIGMPSEHEGPAQHLCLPVHHAFTYRYWAGHLPICCWTLFSNHHHLASAAAEVTCGICCTTRLGDVCLVAALFLELSLKRAFFLIWLTEERWALRS